ncbi:catecholate siderophore receptor Fiu [Acinetobacter indicus]|uniref:Catecholate siderophore receptor Fiu n=1 Tax=Acinetobacter indicus TaxID=756892 RepID=A0A7S6VR70_9GAMM|nr:MULTISPECIES: catecholate siderophore receptor Fiu [Acinetobacter]QIC76899.1 catecholate siderophore receptor Fiu [Acinetobacter indicus]QOW43290.1 catecholate siderophore receptor Fiu [Acinetobacter indicus]
MAQIKSRKHQRTASFVALAATLPLMAHATTATEEVTQLPEITVKSQAENKYKTNQLSSAKQTQPLVDTPQTVSVINQTLLKEQGATSLVEALRNTPGITLQMGENGNTSAGDTFQMRGFSTQTSTYVDGIRDLGAVSRDVFNLEQVEVVKGPAGAEAGRGSASGYINLVSKLPHLQNSSEVSANYNTAENARLSADINQAINDNTAFRLNVMGQEGGVQGRDVLENNSYAIAPSVAFGLNTPTRLYLYSQHVRQRNIPDGGIPTVGMQGFYNTDSLLATAPKVNRENFYGHVNDYEDVDADMFTAKIESDLTDQLKLTNITRVAKTHMNRVLTGINTGANGLRTNGSSNPAEWEVNRSRQGIDQENKILANQSTLNWNVKTGAVQHDVVAGMEFLKEQQSSKLMATQMPGEATADTPWANLYRPDRNQAMPALIYNGGYTDGETQTAAAYVFDTLKFGERFQLNGGVRVDYYETDYQGLTLPRGGNALVATDLSTHDTLFSWKLGAVYKPTLNSSIYAAYAKSLTPPGSANFSLSADGINSAAAKPQETHHYELGTKWDLLEGKLALTAAAYRTENENQFTQDAITRESIQEGKTMVKGVELSAVGQITDAWNVSAGIAHMKTEQENQQSVNATTGEMTKTNNVRWSPEWTASLWSTYDWAGFKLGLGARYVDEQKRVVTDSNAPANMPNIPGYVVFDALVGYNFNKNASLNLNLYNLADKEYISTLNNGGGRVVLGQPRSAALSLNYKF